MQVSKMAMRRLTTRRHLEAEKILGNSAARLCQGWLLVESHLVPSEEQNWKMCLWRGDNPIPRIFLGAMAVLGGAAEFESPSRNCSNQTAHGAKPPNYTADESERSRSLF